MKFGDIVYLDENNLEWYETNVSKWCNENNAMVVEIEPIEKHTYENYVEEENGITTQKTREATKTFRCFKIQEVQRQTITQTDIDVNKQEEYKRKTDPLIAEYQRKTLLGILTKEREKEIIAELDRLTKEIKEQNPDIE